MKVLYLSIYSQWWKNKTKHTILKNDEPNQFIVQQVKPT